MGKPETVAIFVEIPRRLRARIRVAAAMRELTLRDFVARALESALGDAAALGDDQAA